ncbi:MAG: Cysteine desulfurase [Myxococcales bacterium]|nr:Cysteine desulfurase [Myxococcales bacterium]
MNPIYLDNAASTRVSDEVHALMTEVTRTAWGNPSSHHPQGAAARGYIEAARTRLLAALGDRGTGDVVWTSGCSEANALAVLGAARVRTGRLVMSTLEHPAIGTLGDRLAAEGRDVVRIAPGPDGVLDADEVAEAAATAAVVSIVMVQNEIGVVQPIASIVAAIRTRSTSSPSSCHIHIDGAQALGKVPIDVAALGIDSLSIAGHKLHGPKGTGALWLRKAASIEPLWVGGGQQRGLRGGTQDAPGAAGLGLAAERAVAARTTARTRWLELSARVTSALPAGIVRQLVPDHRRAPHILALAVSGVPAEALRNVLSSRGVYISTGSACADGDSKPSVALTAIGLPQDAGMVRLSFALDTKHEEVDEATKILAAAIRDLTKA